MNGLEEYIRAASKNGRPPRSGIILAIRMCLLALRRLEMTVPTAEKRRLIVIVETDRCLPDAIQLVTGCRLANRTLKLRDMGKMAAVLVDLETRRGVRIAALESANNRALELYPEREASDALSLAYQTLGDDDLFRVQSVEIHLAPEDLPGYHASRVLCQQCGEGIAFRREIRQGDRTLCRGCAGGAYYEIL
jgi:formylmethanofuran dehydrogenase subunit E